MILSPISVVLKKRITIKDIARSLGIHHSTVSRALRDDPLVNKHTKMKIVDYANQQGYKVNYTALEFRGFSKNKLAIIVPNITHQFFSSIVSHFTNLASSKGYIVSIFQTNENVTLEMEIVDNIIQYNFSGVIASISMESTNTRHYQKLLDHNIPLVMFDRVSDDLEISKVVIDNNAIMVKAVEMLIERNYKSIVHISGPKDFSVFGERQNGYKRAICKHNLKYENLINIEGGFRDVDANMILDNLLNEKPQPDAIICDSALFAKELLEEMDKRKIRIPNDIALIVFTENPMFEVVSPSITTIKQPTKEIGEKVLKLIENRILYPKSIIETIKLEAEIRIRGSI